VPRPVVFDTDMGVDDALALCLAFRSPELRIEAVTTVHGNVAVGQATDNVFRVLSVLNVAQTLAVASGSAKPLRREPVHAEDVHGSDGLGGVTRLRNVDGSERYPRTGEAPDRRSSSDVFAAVAEKHPGQATLVAVGPLTNVARFVSDSPNAARRFREFVVMGGAFRRHGNMSPVAEFNVYADPHAAEIVLNSGVPLTLVPLDVTETVVLSQERVQRHAATRLGRFIAEMTAEYMDFGRRVEGVDGCFVHDALAVAYLIRPDWFRGVARRVAVETEGAVAYGQTVADLREPPRFAAAPNATILVGVDADAFLHLFETRVLNG
jgi:inosine-uridine nucleoside N-ribohydrolase